MGLFDSVGGFLGDVVSAYSSHREAAMQRDFNKDEAEKNRQWQEQMANTQYQRTVEDLNAAGLSPMLAYSKGATSLPGGGAASSGAVGQGVKFGETESRSAQSELMREQINVAKAQEQLNIQNAKKAAEEAKLTALTVEQMPTRFYYDLANIGSQINSNTANTNRTNIQARNDANLEAPGTGLGIVRDVKNLGRSAIERFKEISQDAGSWLNYGKDSLTKGLTKSKGR